MIDVKHIETCPLTYWHQLPDDVRVDYDWEHAKECLYFEYRECWYCLDGILALYCDTELRQEGWVGSATISNTAAIVVKFDEMQDNAIVGMVY